MSSDSESSFEIIDDIMIDTIDDSESNSSDSSFEEIVKKTEEAPDVTDSASDSEPDVTGPVEKASDVQETSESSSEDAVKPNEPVEKAPTNSWRDETPMALRNHLVGKFATAILNGQTYDDDDDGLKEVIAYSRCKENECFEKANDREEYYHLLAELIYKIQVELKRKAEECKARESQVAQEEEQPEVAEEQVPKRTAENRAGRIAHPGLLEIGIDFTSSVEEPVEEISTSSESTDEQKPRPDSRPILEEISGCWKVVSYQNQDQLDNTDSLSMIGTNLKLEAFANCIKVFNHYTAHSTHESYTVQITPKDACPSNDKLRHDYIEDKQWMVESRGHFYKLWIENGQLRIEHDNGVRKFVFERTQDKIRGNTDNSLLIPIMIFVSFIILLIAWNL